MQSLETSRDRTIKAAVSTIIGVVVAAVGMYMRHLLHK
jgi:hypothetical protein